MLFRAGYGSQVCRTAQLYPYSRFSSHKYAFLCDFEQVWAFHGIVAVWKKKSSPRSVVCLGDQECFSRYGIDCRSSYRLMCVLTMTSRFSHKHDFFSFCREYCACIVSMLMEEEEIKPGAAGHVTTCFSFCCRHPTAAVAHMMLIYVLLPRCHLPAAVLSSGTGLLLSLPLLAACHCNVLLPPTAVGLLSSWHSPAADLMSLILLLILCCQYSYVAVTCRQLMSPPATVLSPTPIHCCAGALLYI